jgi:hypothetical protein
VLLELTVALCVGATLSFETRCSPSVAPGLGGGAKPFERSVSLVPISRSIDVLLEICLVPTAETLLETSLEVAACEIQSVHTFASTGACIRTIASRTLKQIQARSDPVLFNSLTHNVVAFSTHSQIGALSG